MVEEKQGYVKTWLSGAVLIVFVATVLDYFLTYLLVISYAKTLGIPWEFVSLNPASLVVILALILPLAGAIVSLPAFYVGIALVGLIALITWLARRYLPSSNRPSRNRAIRLRLIYHSRAGRFL